MIASFLFTLWLLAINYAIKWYAESEIIFLRTQLKLLETLDTLLQIYPDIKPYTTQASNIQSDINKKLHTYQRVANYGLMTPFYNFFYD